MTMRSFAFLAGIAALILDPLWACSGSDYGYTAQRMRVALDGVWTVSSGGKTSTFRIDFGKTHRSTTSFVAPAGACGHNTIVSSAEACIDLTTMQLRLIAIGGELPTEAEFEVGEVEAISFHSGRLRMRFAGGFIDASVTAAGNVEAEGPDVRILHAASPYL